MRLRNKKTGGIGELQITEKHCAVAVGNGTASCGIEIYSSLAELNENWEDYKEKEYFYLNMDGDIRHTTNQAMVKYSKEIGNYFETEEEAEKAVEKLKALANLRKNGFRFIKWKGADPLDELHYRFIIEAETEGAAIDDLDLLFSGGENE